MIICSQCISEKFYRTYHFWSYHILLVLYLFTFYPWCFPLLLMWRNQKRGFSTPSGFSQKGFRRFSLSRSQFMGYCLIILGSNFIVLLETQRPIHLNSLSICWWSLPHFPPPIYSLDLFPRNEWNLLNLWLKMFHLKSQVRLDIGS